jgi:RNA polymerase sigma factor (sigma-70 family)
MMVDHGREAPSEGKSVTRQRIESREEKVSVDALVAELRNGNMKAVPFLVSQFLEELTRFAASIAPDLSMAEHEEAAERGVEAAARKIALFDPTEASFPTWARAFVQHEIGDLRRDPERWGAQPREEWFVTTPEPEDILINDERAPTRGETDALAEVVARLRPSDIEILGLRASGLTHAEIALKLRINEDTSRQRWRRASARARRAAAELGYPSGILNEHSGITAGQ